MNGFKLTERAAMAIRYAQESAIELGGGVVGTEHLLVGLLRAGDGIAAKALESRGISYENLYGALEQYYASTPEGNGKVQFTPRTKNVLELSVMQARKLKNNYIGTEHILLTILAEGEGLAIRMIMELGADPADLYAFIIKSLTEENPFASKAKSAPQNNSTPELNKFGRDLTELAKSGKIDPIVGRNEEIDRVVQILSRRTKNNPCLIGEPGVGKTAVAEGLAQHIINGNVPEILKNKRLFALDMSSMLAGAKYRGEFEERLKKAMEEVVKAGDVIIFIDEIHTIIGAGAAEG
ncbi:MAG: ATP-dependent Clp protease ATP-binding subunit, partial [Clostridia bacterium]|nr:ATP-dependent Clp protease ATP-binding subunit [Clostridia bacterium]